MNTKFLVTINVETVNDLAEGSHIIGGEDKQAICDTREIAMKFIKERIDANNKAYERDNASGRTNIAQAMDYNLTEYGTYVRYRDDKTCREWMHAYCIYEIPYVTE